MAVDVRLFAILRDAAGTGKTTIPYQNGMTVDDALVALRERGMLPDKLSRKSFLCAVNLDYAASDRVLVDGDELALIPPVSGG